MSQTFVIQQVNGLIAEGHDVSVASMYEGDLSLWDNALLAKNNLKNKTNFLLPNEIRTNNKIKHIIQIMLGMIKLLFTRPSAFMFILFNVYKVVASGGLLFLNELISITKTNKSIDNSTSIIAHFGDIGVLAGLLAKTKAISNNIFTVFHGYEISEFKALKEWTLWYVWLAQHSTKLLPISELWASKLRELGIASSKIEVVHMGINLNDFTFDPHTNQTETFNLLSVARAVEKKGLTYSLEGAELSNTSFTYNIIGGGPLTPNLEKQISNYKNKNNFVFHGPKSSQFVAQQLKASDIFVLTSVTSETGDMEGIPVSLMEAMASGVIVLSTYHSGIPELIENGKTGFLVDERDAQAIGIMIENIVNHPNLELIRKQAFAKVNDEFNQAKINIQLSNIIETETAN
ncbi:glycosyltransferase [Glaciecola sp. 2405UD65-10]|uniref:glycosyltransferase n=1 Tax=Glaciecola sp. 2405UD65-10 TaxID=3397244 RepID=UPI003B5BE154